MDNTAPLVNHTNLYFRRDAHGSDNEDEKGRPFGCPPKEPISSANGANITAFLTAQQIPMNEGWASPSLPLQPVYDSLRGKGDLKIEFGTHHDGTVQYVPHNLF
jgi:hypothetical protein